MALEGTNSVVDIVPNAHRYSILQDGDGLFLSSADGELAFVEHVDDSAVWNAAEGGQYKHPLTGAVVDLSQHGVTAEWGPESLPSAYLEHLIEKGHVCMPALIAPENCLALQQLASEPSDLPMVMRSPLGIGVSSHPVAMWVIKSYLRSDYKLAHSPGFAILKPGLGIDGTGGWHSCEPAHASTHALVQRCVCRLIRRCCSPAEIIRTTRARGGSAATKSRTASSRPRSRSASNSTPASPISPPRTYKKQLPLCRLLKPEKLLCCAGGHVLQAGLARPEPPALPRLGQLAGSARRRRILRPGGHTVPCSGRHGDSLRCEDVAPDGDEPDGQGPRGDPERLHSGMDRADGRPV